MWPGNIVQDVECHADDDTIHIDARLKTTIDEKKNQQQPEQIMKRLESCLQCNLILSA